MTGAVPVEEIVEDAELRLRHGLPASTFAQVAGVDLHYVEEGEGPAVLLLHGSYASLRQWDKWAKGLREGFRVVRFDMPAFGLSGPDPTGDYGCERKIALILALADRLRIKRFFLVGTSSAGVPAAAFAAYHPDRLIGLVLNNIAVGPLKHDAVLPPALLKEIEQGALHPGWHASSFWREVLHMHYANPERIADDDVGRWTELNNRRFPPELTPDPAEAEAEFSRTPQDLANIICPTLLLWSDGDKEVPVEREGQAALKLLSSIDKTLQIVTDCGHMTPNESGERGLAYVQPFFDRLTPQKYR